ncbi:hypothetical protein GGQ71_004890 [Rhizobium taibaishanense]|nr:hypothetical protein [Allorhizobium taibaishanense]
MPKFGFLVARTLLNQWVVNIFFGLCFWVGYQKFFLGLFGCLCQSNAHRRLRTGGEGNSAKNEAAAGGLF